MIELYCAVTSPQPAAPSIGQFNPRKERGAAAPANAETILYNFSGPAGDRPRSPLAFDGAGNLYGTTDYGGDYNRGTVYTIRTDGSGFHVLHHFQGGTGDGAVPFGGVLLDGAGNLYGTTLGGGAPVDTEKGTVYTMQIDGSAFTLLHRFTGGVSDGEFPWAGLTFDAAGNLYGTTSSGGGLPQFCPEGSFGCGTVFTLAPDDSNYRLVYTFPTLDCLGTFTNAPLAVDANGYLYSTTAFGPGFGELDNGTVFKLAPDGSSCSTLWTFQDFPVDGGDPEGGLTLDGAGNLYGTTFRGGTSGGGTVFQVATDGSTYNILHHFRGPEGGEPQGGLALDAAGNLYGTTILGGAFNHGVVFSLPF